MHIEEALNELQKLLAIYQAQSQSDMRDGAIIALKELEKSILDLWQLSVEGEKTKWTEEIVKNESN